MAEGDREHLLGRSMSYALDELRVFRAWLRWLCVDHSTFWTASLSWLVFLALAVVVPILSHLALPSGRSRPYDAVAQISLTGVASLSFICLSNFVRKYGLRRFLFFDKLCDESETVRNEYTKQFNISMKLLFTFVIPCLAAEAAYKIQWYAFGGKRTPFLGRNPILSNTVACVLELCSWFYRTVVFFLVCVLFHLICCLQILRLHDFAQVFEDDSDAGSVLREHLRIRRHLRIISHRFRSFILWALVLITASQFASLLLTTRSKANVNLRHTGELAVCSVSLVAGLLILLRSATRITHKAQAMASLAAKWNVCVTIDLFHTTETETPIARVVDENLSTGSSVGSSDVEHVEDEEDKLDNTKFIPSYAQTTITFQRRQALVTYFENNSAGITIYGFMLDRSSIHMIFGMELSLVLWLLGKTIGIS